MTTIQEKEYDKKITVSGQKFSCDDVDLIKYIYGALLW